MRHIKTYHPFCPSISIRPTPSYAHILEEALRSYPGADGDAVKALSFMAQHQAWSIESAVAHYTAYHEAEDSKAYADAWVIRYLTDLHDLESS